MKKLKLKKQTISELTPFSKEEVMNIMGGIHMETITLTLSSDTTGCCKDDVQQNNLF